MPHFGLHSIRPPNHIFDKLMSYRSYRLKIALDTGTSLETTKIRLHIKNMTINLKKDMFSGADRIHISNFLIRFVNKTDTLRMT